KLRYDFFDDPVDWAFAALFALLTLAAWGLRLWEPSIARQRHLHLNDEL
ncbi:MAG: hypothetical protein HZB28_11490, partial [Methylocystis sp.]|nr:hypothetical protein [Methylocystis sp.]